MSPEHKNSIFQLEKSIYEQNKLISKQISRFFERAKTTLYKSLQNIKKPLLNEVKETYNYSYLGFSIKQKNLSFRQVMKNKISSKNIKMALERDSMKNLNEINSKKAQINKNITKNLFKSNGSSAKIYSRRNTKLNNNSIEFQNKKKKPENISDSMKEITANDFGTLGKEGNTIWIRDDSRKNSKDKYHYVDKIQKNQISADIFRNKVANPQISQNIDTKTMKKHVTKPPTTSRLRRSNENKKKLLQLKNKQKYDRNLDFVISEIIQDKELRSVISNIKSNVKHKMSNRSRSAITNKREPVKNNFYFPESKYQLLRDLDKKIKQSRNQSMKSDIQEKNLDNESSIILKENQLKMREIRRNYMKKWKEERSQAKKKSIPRNRSHFGKSKSTKTYSRAKVNQWAYQRNQKLKFIKGLSSISNDSTLGSLNKPPEMNFIKNGKPKNSISLYKKRNQSKAKSVKPSTKERNKKVFKVSKSRKSKIKKNKIGKVKRKEKRTYTNKFESTKMAFEYVKGKKKKKNISNRSYW